MTGKLIICSVAILALETYWSNQYGPKVGKFEDPCSRLILQCILLASFFPTLLKNSLNSLAILYGLFNSLRSVLMLFTFVFILF